jgi:hypothetical protein
MYLEVVLMKGVKDYELGQLLSTIGDDYTVLLFSDPNEFTAYEPSFVEPMRTDLKRRAEGEPVYVGRRAGNGTRDSRGLFEKYQFFTPGISPFALFDVSHHLGVRLTVFCV